MGNQLARWFAVAVVGINAIEMMFFIPAYPFWALVIIAANVVALWGLCAYGSRENLEAVWQRRGPGPVPAGTGSALGRNREARSRPGEAGMEPVPSFAGPTQGYLIL